MKQAWIRLSCGYWRDPKFNGLGPMHEALYVRLLAYTVEHDTDGLIPANAVALCGRRIYNREKVLEDLIHAGLILPPEPESTSYLFPISWYKYQKSKAISNIESAGQEGSSRAGVQEERRGDISNRTSSSRAPRRMTATRLFEAGQWKTWNQDSGQWEPEQTDTA